jgi:serine/threonine protein kinase
VQVICGKVYAGPEVDIWSCGVILYAMLANCLPFDNKNINELFRSIQSGTYKLPDHLSPGARDLIIRMLTVDPIRRITMPEIKYVPLAFNRFPSRERYLHMGRYSLGGVNALLPTWPSNFMLPDRIIELHSYSS